MIESDTTQCRLLVGPAAVAAQLLLAALALGSLLYKRHIEQPQRPLNIWGLDVSKQAISMLAAHICGMLIALIAHHRVASASSSECAWYFVAFSFDTTLGLLLTIALHKAALRFARWCGERHAAQYSAAFGDAAVETSPAREPWWAALQLCGNYGAPPSYRRWGFQLGEWVVCVVLARALCGTFVVLLGGLLVHIAQGLDRLFVGHPTAELYVVMICCPLLLNICQVLVQDLVLKWRSRDGSAAAKETSLATAELRPAGDELEGQQASLLGPAFPWSAAVQLCRDC